jgi:5-methylcytosine-specific restriction endonuclease McrA
MARDYKKEYAEYHSRPEQKKNRAQRNAARREMEEKGLVRKGDGKDVDHKKPIDRGGSNDGSNLRVLSKSKNRGYRRDSKNQPR